MNESLLSRLQSATGPSRELDAEIALANGWTYEKRHSGRPRGGDAHPYWRKPGVTDWYMREANGPPRYTESIAATLTLAEVRRLTIDWVLGTATIMTDSGTYTGSAKTAENALLIAIERAKEDSKP